MIRFTVGAELLAETFRHFRHCGGSRRECQVLWISPWDSPQVITRVVHSEHRAHAGGFELDSIWLNAFWIELAATRSGIRVQVHTHPHEAFHSPTDDAFPIVHTPGFLSLVIPDFGIWPPSLDNSYLAEITASGAWQSVEPASRIVVTP